MCFTLPRRISGSAGYSDKPVPTHFPVCATFQPFAGRAEVFSTCSQISMVSDRACLDIDELGGNAARVRG